MCPISDVFTPVLTEHQTIALGEHILMEEISKREDYCFSLMNCGHIALRDLTNLSSLLSTTGIPLNAFPIFLTFEETNVVSVGQLQRKAELVSRVGIPYLVIPRSEFTVNLSRFMLGHALRLNPQEFLPTHQIKTRDGITHWISFAVMRLSSERFVEITENHSTIQTWVMDCSESCFQMAARFAYGHSVEINQQTVFDAVYAVRFFRMPPFDRDILQSEYVQNLFNELKTA